MKKKILFILHLPPPVHGAAMVGQYIKDSKVINDFFEIDYINLSTSKSITEIGKRGVKKIINLIKIQSKVFNALLNKKYEYCYLTITASGSGLYKDLLVVFILKIFRKNIVYHFHNKGIQHNRRLLINDLIYRFIFKNTKTILLSPSLASDFIRYVRKDDIYFCGNGIPVTEKKIKKTIENKSTSCRILFLSNISIEKGVILLLEACKILSEKNYKFECYFVGGWGNISESEFKNMVHDNNLENKIFYSGPKYGKDKDFQYCSADIFVLPTFSECFPLVLLEAMNFGLPIISTEEGGIPDIVDHGITGFVVKPKDLMSIVSHLELLINDPSLRDSFGIAGKKKFEENFTIEKFEQKFIHVLNSAIHSVP